MKVKVKTKLVWQNSQKNYEVTGILYNHCLSFFEDNDKVIIDIKEKSMKRENKERKLYYIFHDNEETLNDFIDLESNSCIKIPLFTEKIDCFQYLFSVSYKIEDNLVTYQVKWEEIV